MKNINEIAAANNYMAMIKGRISRVVSWTFLFSTILISCSKSSGSNNATSAAPGTVSIVNMTFTPASITVTPGTTVTWNNNDNMTHTVTADDNGFDSGNISAGSSFAKTFPVAGTFTYHCTLHPSMIGTVVVK